MTIPVEPGYLFSIREQSSFTWKSMVCELVDNAFDADASVVKLSWPGGQVFSVSDDGCGTSDLLRMITLGSRFDHNTNDIGKYGVGVKLALIWLWGQSEIASTFEGVRKRLAIDWNEIAIGAAAYPDHSKVACIHSVAVGTEIRCMASRCYPKFDSLIKSLESTYTPGIEAGKNIVVTLPKQPSMMLKGRQWPKTDEVIDDMISVAGRSVRVIMGIVSDGVFNPYTNGFSFERTYRVIKETTLGANGFSVSRIAARIVLGKDWTLSTNKDDFAEYQDELAEAIHDRCGDLMQRASEQAISIEDMEFNRELAMIVSTSKRRESRGGGESDGSVEPKNTGRKRESAKQSTDNDGSVIGERRKRCGFTVETYTADSSTLGYYDSDGNRVRLNMGNSWLAAKHRERSQDALIPVIYGIVAAFASSNNAKKHPLFKGEIDSDFATIWGQTVESAAIRQVSV